MYASKLFEIVKAHLADVHAYADDIHLYLSFKPDSEDNQTEAVDAVQECIEDIRAWMAADQLKLNAPINLMPAGGGGRQGIGWGFDFFEKFTIKFPAHGQIIPVKSNQNFPTRGCTLLSIPSQNLRKAQ